MKISIPIPDEDGQRFRAFCKAHGATQAGCIRTLIDRLMRGQISYSAFGDMPASQRGIRESSDVQASLETIQLMIETLGPQVAPPGYYYDLCDGCADSTRGSGREYYEHLRDHHPVAYAYQVRIGLIPEIK